jgi:long-subunit acyl-CoA synthetase (AMP-forming)
MPNMRIYKSTHPDVQLTDVSIVDFLLSTPKPREWRSSVDSVTGETKIRGQVFDEALSLARGLITRKNAKPGQVAMILGKTSVDYPVVALGCMAAGLIPSLASAAW